MGGGDCCTITGKSFGSLCGSYTLGGCARKINSCDACEEYFAEGDMEECACGACLCEECQGEGEHESCGEEEEEAEEAEGEQAGANP